MTVRVKSKFKGGNQRKKAVELGEVADIYNQNWETLMGFRPRLEPYGAETHNPPEMGTDNSPIPTSEDTNKPDQGNLSGGGAEKENPPHENESVDHIKPNSEQKTTKKKAEGEEFQTANDMNHEAHEGVEDGEDFDVSPSTEEEVERLNNEYRERWTVSHKIADLKISAGQWSENDRYEKADTLAHKHSMEDLQEMFEDNRQMLQRVNGSKKKASVPRGYTTGGRSTGYEDPLQEILAGME